MKNFLEKFWAMLNIKNNFAMKVVSLVLAIFFWIFVMDKENPIVTRTFYNVPIAYAGQTDPGLVVSSAPTYYSNIEISGRRNSVLATRSDSFILKVNLSGLKDGRNEAKIEYSTHLNDINIDRVSPSNVVVTLEKVIDVEKPVFYNRISDFDDSLSRSEILIEPTAVMVTGPRSLVAGVTSVIANVEVSEIQRSTEIDIPLIPINSLGEKVEGVSLARDSASVKIKAVREKVVPFTYEYRDDTDKNHKVIRFIVSTNTVRIVGDPDIVDGIDSLKAIPVVITSPDNASGILEFQSINGLTILNADKIRYQAEYEESSEADLNFVAKDFAFVNLSDGLVATVDESTVVVVHIKGIRDVVEKVKVQDFSLSLDLKDLDAGEHLVVPRLQYLLQDEIDYEILEEMPIKVVITKKTEE